MIEYEVAHTIPPIKVYLTRGLHQLEKGRRCEIALYKNPLRGKRTMERGQDGGRELPVKVYVPPPH